MRRKHVHIQAVPASLTGVYAQFVNQSELCFEQRSQSVSLVLCRYALRIIMVDVASVVDGSYARVLLYQFDVRQHILKFLSDWEPYFVEQLALEYLVAHPAMLRTHVGEPVERIAKLNELVRIEEMIQ